ncbi:MAG: tRNA (adenosine(37)-N6)-threonylcarbamoyltransferase complex transferase subunit TsaD [Ignavibacteriae bacterium]|nr:tRNA (adenosine(37)-N6)-threonylcarbamoyltransferase complex transferase subunit TsaD [Ignavibacteriota bacterium]MCB9217122.1 tRNA (adenosine(37)-N6)-threonylcarbamoyltransferase complex transferase subunit TsaD [Ignavibacteria bacterium]
MADSGETHAKTNTIILAIETSCDDTSVAIIRDGEVASVIVSSQAEHEEWGGVVPELASRAHLNVISPILTRTIEKAGITFGDVNAIAVTNEPGLIGSLLVGLNVAKGLAVALGKPLITVNHIEAHLLSVMLEQKIDFPYLALVVSGGHTMLYDVQGAGNYTLLGATRDDAAGEAFDKGGKLLGLGYPGGPLVDRYGAKGDPTYHKFPRSLLDDSSDDFSFSGLKTSLRYFLRDRYPNGISREEDLADICASYQEAIVDSLLVKTFRAAKGLGYSRIAIVGGVSANSRLREKFQEKASKEGMTIFLTSPIYSTDNAAMIGLVGWLRYKDRKFNELTVTAKGALSEAKAVRRGKGGVRPSDLRK